ncbi:MAG TPA: 2-succinyl-5-enolpyruvyl-6-hydroxy-3-cyclohexene-1-carboxylic-acid synthase [Kofleriaceae bacterium]
MTGPRVTDRDSRPAGAVQTLWAELIAATLADTGVRTCVVSPGSRSTPLVLALAADGRLALPAIIDERAAAFFALGIARASGEPVALVCTSGSAAAHYLPALVEASASGVPLIAITADRPPELQQCGATQTIDQIDLYGRFVRDSFDLGAPVGSPIALRALRRKISQAIALARGPHAGPVHVQVPLRKPLEPALPGTDDERALAKLVAELRRTPITIAVPQLAADPTALDALATAIAAEPRGLIVAGALPAQFPREALFALAARTGYPLLAEAGSQCRFGPRPPNVTAIDYFDLILAAPSLAGAQAPKLIIQLGAEPVAAGWAVAQPLLAGAARHVLAAQDWRDPDSSARSLIIGELGASLEQLVACLDQSVSTRFDTTDQRSAFTESWRSADTRVHSALGRALASHPRSEDAVMQAVLDAVPATGVVQIGNSLPIRVVDHVRGGGAPRTVIAQRGAAGIDGLIASAAGATRAGAPVVLVLGDVSFAHDLGGLLAARHATAPLAIVVVDNNGGRIFSGLPVARTSSATFDEHFLTAPEIDPAAVATALGVRAITAASPAAVSAALATALATPGPTVIHAPVTATGAHDVRRDALELLVSSTPSRSPSIAVTAGASHV